MGTFTPPVITASVKIKGYIQGYGAGRMDINTTPITSILSNPTVIELTAVAGDNTIQVPAGTTGVLITLPAADGNTYTLKGAAGDTGIQIAPNTNQGGANGTILLPLNLPGGGSFIINQVVTSVQLGFMKFQFF